MTKKKPIRVKILDHWHVDGYPVFRLRVLHKRPFTGVARIDRKLTNYDIYIALPHRQGRLPVLFSLQGIGAPIHYSFYQIKSIVEMGMVWVGVDAPFGGSRNVTRGKIQALPQIYRSLRKAGVNYFSLEHCFHMLNEDLHDLAYQVLPRYFQVDYDRVGLVGVSFGVMLATWAFVHHNFGQHLVGLIGHGNMHFMGWKNPLHHTEKVHQARRYHLMLGEHDHMIDRRLANQIVHKMPTGSMEIAHNVTHGGGRFEEASIATLRQQLGAMLY